MTKPISSIENINHYIQKEKMVSVILAISMLAFTAFSIYAAHYGMTAAPSPFQKTIYLLSSFACAISFIATPLAFMILIAAAKHKFVDQPKNEEFYGEL